MITIATNLPHEIDAKCQPVHWNLELNWYQRRYWLIPHKKSKTKVRKTSWKGKNVRYYKQGFRNYAFLFFSKSCAIFWRIMRQKSRIMRESCELRNIFKPKFLMSQFIKLVNLLWFYFWYKVIQYYHFVGHCGAFYGLKRRIWRAEMYFSPLK